MAKKDKRIKPELIPGIRFCMVAFVLAVLICFAG